MRRYLIVADKTLGGDTLVEAVRERAMKEPSEFWVLVLATPASSFRTGYDDAANRERRANAGDTAAQEQLDVELQRLHAAGVDADGEVGDQDPLKAIADVLKRQQFDEIILSTLPEERSRWLRRDLPRKIRKRYQIPLTHIATPASHW